MDDETAALFEEFVGLLQDAHLEIRAMRGLLIDRKIISDEELSQRVEEVKRSELFDLKAEVKRRAMEKAWRNPPS